MKMQVKIITRHSPANYGSLLQSIATQKLVEQIGYSNEIIDYISKEETGIRIAFTQLKGKTEWNHNLLKKIAYIIMREPENLTMYCKFAKMRRKYLLMTKRFSSYIELEEYFKNSEDIFMTGSDQVWGPVSTGKHDLVYFLNFVPNRCKKVAFAASFGKAKFDENIIQEYKKYLVQYDNIAVRENTAVKILREINIDAKQVLDPTLLIDSTEWVKYIKKDKKETEEYILIYQIHNDHKLNQYAKKFASKTKLKLIRVSPILHQIKRGGKFVYLPDISEFLSLIKNAKYLITDSFHGTAFAINFNTQFIEILPNTGTSSRNQSILKLTELEDRVLTDLEDFSYIDSQIDFSKVNKIIQKNREESIEYLKKFITIED